MTTRSDTITQPSWAFPKKWAVAGQAKVEETLTCPFAAVKTNDTKAV